MGRRWHKPSQKNLPLPETRNEGFEEKHFLRLHANGEAFDALLAWQARGRSCEQPHQRSSRVQNVARVKALCGPAQCGKSHLGEIWRLRNDARTLSPLLLQHEFENAPENAPENVSENVSKNIPLLARPLWLDFSADDDPAQGMPPSLERALYALYNEVIHSTTGSLLITARSEPSRWQFSLADLRSRMRAVAVLRIEDPSDDDSALLLEKIFHTRQLEVDARVYAYVHRRIERSFRAHHAIAEELDSLSLAHKHKITRPFVARHLSASLSGARFSSPPDKS